MKKLIYVFCLLGFFQAAAAADIPPVGKWCHLTGAGFSSFQKNVNWSLDYSLTGGGGGGRGGYTFAATGWLNVSGNFTGSEDIWVEWSPHPLSTERRSIKLTYQTESNKFTGNLRDFHIATVPTPTGFDTFKGGLYLTININGQGLALLSGTSGPDNQISIVTVGECDP